MEIPKKIQQRPCQCGTKKTFFKSVLDDERGVPSSKRAAAFITLLYALVIYAIRGEAMDYDIFLTLMLFVTGALGISGMEKFAKKPQKP